MLRTEASGGQMKTLIDGILQRVIMCLGGIYIALISLINPVWGMTFVLDSIDRLEQRRQHHLRQEQRS
jgi:hypothetical protein